MYPLYWSFFMFQGQTNTELVFWSSRMMRKNDITQKRVGAEFGDHMVIIFAGILIWLEMN